MILAKKAGNLCLSRVFQKNKGMKKNGLEPLMCENPEILILGSLPGDKSLELQEYYGHPRNRFWKVIAAIGNYIEPVTYDEKIGMLAKANIILWDVYQAADRAGSMDADIKHGDFNDIFSLLAKYPTIKTIALNGKTAEKAFYSYNRTHQVEAQNVTQKITICPMPSTSPANASWTLEKLVPVWKRIYWDVFFN